MPSPDGTSQGEAAISRRVDGARCVKSDDGEATIDRHLAHPSAEAPRCPSQPRDTTPPSRRRWCAGTASIAHPTPRQHTSADG